MEHTQHATGQEFVNPAHHSYLADPFVFQWEGTFYAVGTGESEGRPDGKLFPTLRSEDFIRWEEGEGALIPPDESLGTNFWAPEIAHSDGVFYLYYSVGVEDRGHKLRVATGRAPCGPFTDCGPLLDDPSCSFAIDPHAFQDRDGQWYLFYARDFLDSDRPGTSIVVAPLEGMTRISKDFTVVARAGHDWQRFEKDRSIYGGIYDWHALEGPCMVHHEGRYYCLYTGGHWQTERYGLDYVWSDSILGPYVDDNPGDAPRLLKTVPDLVIGPGHNSVVLGPNGLTQYIAYHAWDAKKTARRLCFDVLDWTPEGPRCLGPTYEPKVVDW
jgi:beta-xylosidase